jgi:hypothetical protein
MLSRNFLLRNEKREYLAQINSSPSNSGSPKVDFWRDSAWQSVGVIVAILLTLLTTVINLIQSQRKSFSYKVISSENILDVATDIKEKVQIVFESKPIQDLFLVIIEFENSGNTLILPTDFHRLINISFGEEAEILSVEVQKQSPNDLGVEVKCESKDRQTLAKESNFSNSGLHNISRIGDRIIVKPVLINVGDSFILKILVTSFSGIFIDGRIAGINQILEKDEYISRYMSALIPWIPAFSITIGFIYLFFWNTLLFWLVLIFLPLFVTVSRRIFNIYKSTFSSLLYIPSKRK